LSPVADRAASTFVQTELGFDQRSMVFQQPFDSVVIAALFIGCQRDDDVAVGFESLLFEADQIGDEDRGHRLVVGGSPSVVITILFEELEWIERPVVALRLDNVYVREQQDWLARAGPAQTRDQIALARVRSQNFYVFFWKARRFQPLGHRFGGGGTIAD